MQFIANQDHYDLTQLDGAELTRCTEEGVLCKELSGVFYALRWQTQYVYTFYNAVL